MTFQKLRNTRVLTVPGLDGSGPEHWQTLWERRLDRCERVQMGDWAYPERSKWVRQLDREIDDFGCCRERMGRRRKERLPDIMAGNRQRT